MANLIEIVIRANDAASSVLKTVTGNLDNVGSKLQSVGVQVAAATAAIAIGLTAAPAQAVQFESSMANVGSVLGKSRAEMAALSDEVLKIGGSARAGPQAVADAFYDIVGGVADATKHTEILNAAIATSEAGAADLTATTAALVSIMNAYAASGISATSVSDILTRTVAVGVGTMDEFAGSFANVTALGSQTGVALDELGAAMAFMTTKGLTASIASTSLRQAMVALLNPNKAMTDALTAAGIASGEQALQTLGLAGTYQKLMEATGGSTEILTAATGSVEALQAAMAVGDATFNDFYATFKNGMEGATEAARAIQRESPAFQMDLLKASLQELAITVGQALLPPLNRLMSIVVPIIQAIAGWFKENRAITTALVAFAAALTTVGPLLIGIGSAMKLVTAAQTGLNLVTSVFPAILAAITSPVGLIIIGLTALATVLGVDLLGGFRAIIEQVQLFAGAVGEQGLGGAISQFFTTFEDGSSRLSTIFEGFGMAREQAQGLADAINGVAQQVITGVQAIASAFNGDITSALTGFISAGMDPATALGWTNTFKDIGEAVRNFAILAPSYIGDFVFYAEYHFGRLWSRVQPLLQPLIDWFTGSGETSLRGAIAAVGEWITTYVVEPLRGVWVIIEPHVQRIVDWFNEDFVETVQQVPQWITDNIITPLTSLWTDHLQPALAPVAAFISGLFQPILDLINDVMNGAADALEMLRRIGGAAPARALPGEWAPGQGYVNNSGIGSSAGIGTNGGSLGYANGAQQQADRAAQEAATWAQYYASQSGFGSGSGSSFVGFGMRDSGGRGMAGMPYRIGTGAQPEVFIPDSPGTFYPRGEGVGGGMTVQPGGIVVYESGDPERTYQAVLDALVRLKESQS